MTSAKNDDDVNKHVAMQVNHFFKKNSKNNAQHNQQHKWNRRQGYLIVKKNFRVSA
jgi:hypothetical protein